MYVLIKTLIMPPNCQMNVGALEVQNLPNFVKPHSKESFPTNIKTRP